MKIKILKRSLFGAFIALSINLLVAIIISACIGDGKFYMVNPELISEYGTELNAVMLQTLFSVLYGSVWGGASVIWLQDNWSLLRQTITHLVICSFATFPIVYLMHWTNRSIGGILGYFLVFYGIYLVIWIIKYISMKSELKQLNKKIKPEKI